MAQKFPEPKVPASHGYFVIILLFLLRYFIRIFIIYLLFYYFIAPFLTAQHYPKFVAAISKEKTSIHDKFYNTSYLSLAIAAKCHGQVMYF